jgi:hypothetical protein
LKQHLDVPTAQHRRIAIEVLAGAAQLASLLSDYADSVRCNIEDIDIEPPIDPF